METIRLMTWVNAPVERCFKLSLSVDLHLAAARSAGERVVAGVETGLMGLNQTVTWRGRYFGKEVRHTSLIDALRPCSYFRDVMVEGAFASFQHEHHFAAMDDGTRLRDEVRFQAPLGSLGRIAAKLFLRRHLIRILKRRNALIKQVAESDIWHHYLDHVPASENRLFTSHLSEPGIKTLVTSTHAG